MQLATAGAAGFTLAPQSLEEAFKLADIMAQSEMVPKDFRNKPGNVLVAVQMGSEVGLPPMQAIQNIAVINGRPALWGDAIKAVVLGSPLCEKFEEGFDDQSMTAWVRVKRKGHAERVVSFNKDDADRAGLWGKSGPWMQYPKRMLQMRARGFAARDEFADVLKGLSVAEELQDIPSEKDITPPHMQAADRQVNEPSALPFYPSEKFASNFDQWRDVIQSGKRTGNDIVAMAESKGFQLTAEQKQAVLNIEIEAGEEA